MLKSFKEFINETSNFDEIYSEYWDELLRFCGNFTKDLDTAQEWCQEAFIKAYKNLDQKKDEGSMIGWLKRIAKNNILDNLRKDKKKGYNNKDGVNWEYLDTGEETPKYGEEKDDDRVVDIKEVINKLPPMFQKVFRMYFQEEKKHREIAEELGINIGTSKSNLYKAKARIRKLLGIK